MNLQISRKVRLKLSTEHDVTIYEIEECFLNRCAGSLEDNRQENKTTPPTLWFIALTDRGRKLKVVYMRVDGQVSIKTCYEPNDDELRIYNKFFTN